jgi:hypothetical protein
MGGIDDAIQAMEDDFEGATKLPPIQYAKMRGLYPQKVYAAIRNHKLEAVHCDCGRRVVVIEDADKFFKVGEYAAGRQGTEQALQETEEA